jgi:hypothetical protein
VYPPIAEQLAELVARIEANDKQIDVINKHAFRLVRSVCEWSSLLRAAFPVSALPRSATYRSRASRRICVFRRSSTLGVPKCMSGRDHDSARRLTSGATFPRRLNLRAEAVPLRR